jgi:hypothetical protein
MQYINYITDAKESQYSLEEREEQVSHLAAGLVPMRHCHDTE